MLCVLGTILIVSVIGASVLSNSTTRVNSSSSQVRAWKEALTAAETGGDIAFAELRKALSKDSTIRASQWTGWTQAGGTYTSPELTLGSRNLKARTVVEKCYFDASGILKLGSNPAGNTWYRVRSQGTAPLAGLKRTGMDDALIADGQKHFAAAGSTEMKDITARGNGDSLLRKIDFQYDHFVATYGPNGDGLNKAQRAATSAPSISRRIEQIVTPVTPFFDAAIETAGSFYGLGSAAQIDSYDSRLGPYRFWAGTPLDPQDPNYKYYANSRHGSVQIGSAAATIKGMLYGDVATNGGTIVPSSNITGSIDNTVPFTLKDYEFPAVLSARLQEIAGSGPGQLPNAVTSATSLTPPSAGTAETPVYYVISSLTNALTVNPTTAGTETYVAIHVKRPSSGNSISGNSAAITVNPNVHLQVYFDGNIAVKANDLQNMSPSPGNPKAGNLQFYGVSPPRNANGVPQWSQTVQLASGTPTLLAMTFYAPSADIVFNGNPDFIGTMVCKTFYGGGNVSWHYDRALNDVGELLDFKIASYVEDTR